MLYDEGNEVKRNPLVRPFLKWAGGKRQLLTDLKECLPKRYGTYYEPFVGGGALFLSLQRPRAVISDTNEELTNCYEVVRDNVEDLIAILQGHHAHNSEDYYYGVRDWDRMPNFCQRDRIERAARIVYLNKTCYNGLFRVNSQGQFNVPYGRYGSPNIVDEGVLRAVSRYLREAEVRILHADFAEATASAIRGDAIYFDPPYDPVSSTSSFTGYDVNGFGRGEQTRLKEHIDCLTVRGCKVLLSNAYTPFIASLYGAYTCSVVGAARAINSNPQMRGKVEEILVTNYEQQPNQERRRMDKVIRAVPNIGQSKTLWRVCDQLGADQPSARKSSNGKVRSSREPARTIP